MHWVGKTTQLGLASYGNNRKDVAYVQNGLPSLVITHVGNRKLSKSKHAHEYHSRLSSHCITSAIISQSCPFRNSSQQLEIVRDAHVLF